MTNEDDQKTRTTDRAVRKTVKRCIFCGSTGHDYRRCPIVSRLSTITKKNPNQKLMISNGRLRGLSFQGASKSLFVGEEGYPEIRAGFLTVEEYDNHDEPEEWSRKNKKIDELIIKRLELINTRARTNANLPSINHLKKKEQSTLTKTEFSKHSEHSEHLEYSIYLKHYETNENYEAGGVRKGLRRSLRTINNRIEDELLDNLKEIAITKRPADLELTFKKKPTGLFRFNQEAAPHGPTAPLKQSKILDNPITDRLAEKIADDDLKTTEAIKKLYGRGRNSYFLTKLLTAGTLGLKNQRKLVPTRWGITATDDTIGKELIKEIKELPETEPTIYFGGYLGNYYIILLFDKPWSYELLEGHLPTLREKAKEEGNLAGELVKAGFPSEWTLWEKDSEGYNGRKEYVKETAGGYYAARLSLLEHLKRERRQASALLIRFITEEYTAPMGVWVVREAVKKALKNREGVFNSQEELLKEAKRIALEKFNYDITELLKKSQLLNSMNQQKRLSSFF